LQLGVDGFAAQYGKSMVAYKTAVAQWRELEQQIATRMSIDFTSIDEDKRNDGRAWYEVRSELADGWCLNTGIVREWCTWRYTRDRALAAGLSTLVTAYEQGQLEHADVIPA